MNKSPNVWNILIFSIIFAQNSEKIMIFILRIKSSLENVKIAIEIKSKKTKNKIDEHSKTQQKPTDSNRMVQVDTVEKN